MEEKEEFEAVSIELLENMLANERQRQQVIVAQINEITVHQRQSEMQKAQLLEEATVVQGRIEVLQQLTQKEEEDESKGKVIDFPDQEKPDGESQPKG